MSEGGLNWDQLLSNNPPADVDQDRLARLAEIDTRLGELDDEVERLKKERAPLEANILEEWIDRGIQNSRINGRTVFIRRDFVCGKRAGTDTDQVCRILKDEGLGRLVAEGYNANSLKAWVKEQIEGGADLPQSLADVLSYETIPRMRSTKV
jgi:hypothetical protein